MSKPIVYLKSALITPRKIVIVTHRSPDGDAMGSSLGLSSYLKQKGHSVSVITPTDYPDFLAWLPGNSEVVVFPQHVTSAAELVSKADIIFCLDFNTLKRIDELGDLVRESKAIKVLIDHHRQPEDFAEYAHHKIEASSTAELIFEFIEIMGDKENISVDTGICLYTGIMTDTASFRFPSTTPQTHYIAAFLMEKGVPHYRAHEEIYDTNSYDRLRLLGYALTEKMKVLNEVKTAYITLTGSELKKFNFRTGDTEGLVNYCLSVNGIKLAAFFMEKENMVKVSLRSKGKIDVNTFARQYFNGGGHINAAGGSFEGTIDQAVSHFLKSLESLKPVLS